MKSLDRLTGWAMVLLTVVLVTGYAAVKGLPLLFAPAKLHVTVTFPDATGLTEGSDVRCDGTFVGRVSVMRLKRDGVAVDLWMRLPSPLREDARFAILAKSILGGVFVDVDPGTGELAEDMGGFQGRGSVGILDALGTIFSTREEDGKPGFIENLELAAEAVEQKRGLIGELFEETSALRTHLDSLGAAFSAEEGNLLSVLFNDGEFQQAFDDLASVFGGLEREDTVAGVLAALLMRPESEPAQQGTAIADAFAHLNDVYEAGGGSIPLFDMKSDLWQRLGTFQKYLSRDPEEAPGEERRVGFLLDALTGESGEVLAALRKSFAGGEEGSGEESGASSFLGEDSQLEELFGGVFLFFGFGSGDVRDRAYSLQFYSLLKFFGVFPPLVGD